MVLGGMVVLCGQVCPVICTYKWHCGEVRLAISGSEYQALVYFFAEPQLLEVFDKTVFSQDRFRSLVVYLPSPADRGTNKIWVYKVRDKEDS